MNKEDEIFVAACKKAGLRVNKTINSKISRGLIVIDEQGTEYSVSEDGLHPHIKPVRSRRFSRGIFRKSKFQKRRALGASA